MEKRTLYKEGTYKKGNLHTHTTWSDGMHTPAETAKHYRSKGYDFLALTEDHSYIADMLKRGELSEEEAAIHPNRNMHTNALGIWDSVRFDINKIKNDYKALLICSDGLHGYVSETIIREILESTRSVEDKVRLLIDKALLAGGYDNVSVSIVEQDGDSRE